MYIIVCAISAILGALIGALYDHAGYGALIGLGVGVVFSALAYCFGFGCASDCCLETTDIAVSSGSIDCDPPDCGDC